LSIDGGSIPFSSQQIEEKLQNGVMPLCGKSQIDLAIVEDMKSVFRAFTAVAAGLVVERRPGIST
jgi:hypothetical protein